jgi:ribosomal protein L11 methyltransferase
VIRLAVRVAREHADVVLAELLSLSPGGLEERDVDASTVEYVLYGAAGELPHVGEVRAAAAGVHVEVSTSELADDWAERWRDWHRPLDIGPLRVRPPWAPPRAGALDVVIDPGQAFGTGAHASTRLSLELLAGLPAGGPLADWGCGSGILAVAAARLGFAPVDAVELTETGREAIRRNATANGVAVRASRLDLTAETPPWAPTVTANLTLEVLQAIAARPLERPPQRMIASGVLTARADAVAAAFARHGLAEAERRVQGDWAAVRLERT